MRKIMLAPVLALASLVASTALADPIPPSHPPGDDADARPPAAADAPAGSTASHAEAAPERTANNALYAEGLGSALFYSINYDRTIGDFAARIGFGYLSVSAGATSADGTSGSSASASFLAVPITVSYLGIGSKKNIFELGLGATIFHVGAGASAFNADSKESASAGTTFAFATGIVGYRFQPVDGGLIIRTGIAPIFGGSLVPVLPWPYLALGGVFGS
jgi:hypothetical protein